VFEHNVHQIEEVWQSVCLPNDLVLILNPVFAYNAVQTGGGLSEDSLRCLAGWARRKNVYLNEAFLSLRRDGGNHVDRPVCRAGSTTLVISPENKLVLPCYHLGLEELPIGESLYDLYGTEKVQRLVALEGPPARLRRVRHQLLHAALLCRRDQQVLLAGIAQHDKIQ
jgi:hypothetical protein